MGSKPPGLKTTVTPFQLLSIHQEVPEEKMFLQKEALGGNRQTQ
jgi:hypothetical protein